MRIVRLLLEQHGDATFRVLARALRCQACGDTARAIDPDWSVVLRGGA